MAEPKKVEGKSKKRFLETFRQEVSARQRLTDAKFAVGAAVEVLILRTAERLDLLNENTTEALAEVRAEAERLRGETERKMEAVVEKRERFKAKSAVVSEASEQHQKNGKNNEDSFFSDDDKQEYAVFDGVGGAGNGDRASADAAKAVKAKLAELPADASVDAIKQAMRDAFRAGAAAIAAGDYYDKTKDAHERAGTTAVVVKIHQASDGKRTAVVAHAGDSRAYRRKKDGSLEQLGEDDNKLRDYYASGHISLEDLKRYNRRFAEVIDPMAELGHSTLFTALDRAGKPKDYTEYDLYKECFVITKSITSEPNIHTYELEDGDQLLLTTDGIHDLVPDSTIATAFDMYDDPANITERLLLDSKRGIRVGPGNKTDDDRTALAVKWEDILATEVEQHKQRYIEQISKNEPLTLPLTDVDRDAFQQLVTANHPGLQDAFVQHYQATAGQHEAAWRAAGAGPWIDNMAERAGADATFEQIKKIAYSGADYHLLPGRNDAEIAAFKRVLHEATPENLAAMISNIGIIIGNGWSSGSNRSREFYGLHPDLDAAIDLLAIPTAETLRNNCLQYLRGLYGDNLRVTLKPNADYEFALPELRTELEAAGRETDFLVWIGNLARYHTRNREIIVKIFPDLDLKLDQDGKVEQNRFFTQPLAGSAVELDHTMLYEAQINVLASRGRITEEAQQRELAALKFVDSREMLADNEVLQNLGKLVDVLTQQNGISVDELAALPECIALCKRLEVNAAAVAEAVLIQRDLLVEQAQQREMAERRWTTELAKAGLYVAAGMGLASSAALAATGLPLVAVPAVIAGARLVDRLGVHGFRKRKQSKYAGEAWSALTTSREAFGKLAAADQTYAKVSGTFKSTLEAITARLAQEKRSRFETSDNSIRVSSSDLETTIYWSLLQQAHPDICKAEADAKIAYEDACRNSTGSAADIQSIKDLYIAWQKAVGDRLALELENGIHRSAKAHASLLLMEQEMAKTHTNERTANEQSWVENWPKIAAVLGYSNERASEKVASLGFFTAMGYAGREFLPIRVAMGAFAGARGAEALFMYVQSRSERKAKEQAESRKLTADALKAIDITKVADAKAKLQALQVAVAENRDRLTDAKFKRAQAAHYEQVQWLVKRYDQLRIAVQAQEAINGISMETGAFETARVKREDEAFNALWLRRAGAFVGALIGAELTMFLVDAATNLANAHEHASSGNGDTSGSTAADTGHPNAPEPGAATDTSSTAGGAGGTPTPEPQPGAPAPATGVIGTAAELAHKVGKTLGLSHGLTGQGSKAEVTKALLTTKVTLHGKEMSLMATGVRNADEVSPVLRADGHVDLYDANDGHLITSGEMDKYLYDFKAGPGSTGLVESHPAHTGVEAAHPAGSHPDVDATPTGGTKLELGPLPTGAGAGIVEGVARAVEHAPLAGESSTHYVVRELREAFASHPQWGYDPSTSDDDLLHNPLYQSFRDQLEGRYRSFSGAEAGIPGTGGGRSPVEAGRTAADATPLPADATLLKETGERLNALGMKLLALSEHIKPTGEIDGFDEFRKEILHLLDIDNRDRITAPDGLVFEERGGQLYVDVAGGANEHYVLTPRLYQELMQEWKNHVEPALDGKFDKDAFFAALDRAETKHDLHAFELDRYDLQDMNEGGNYSSFMGELGKAMDIHETNRFTGGNQLTFSREGGTYFVSYLVDLGTKHELTPTFYEELMRTYEKLLTYSNGNFDSKAYHQVLDAVDGKR